MPSYMDKNFNMLYERLVTMEKRVGSIYQVLEQIIGKELLRGQALHKVLMDKAIFTDAELKTAVETLVEEGKAEMKAMEAKAKEEKAKAIELLVPSTFTPTPVTAEPPATSTPPTETV